MDIEQQEQERIVKAVRRLAEHHNRMTGGRARASVQGAITSEGRFVSQSELTRNGLQIIRRDGSPYMLERIDKGIASSSGQLGVPMELVAKGSHELSEDQNPFDSGTDNCIESPWPYALLKQLLINITMHAACVETKASDYTSSGYSLEPTQWAKENIDPAVLDEAQMEVESFLNTIADGRGIESLLRDVMIDYESLGCCVFEIRRDVTGFIGRCNHIPFDTIRLTQKKFFERTGARFIQRRWQKKVYYTALNYGLRFIGSDGVPFDPIDATAEMFPSYDKREDSIELEESFVDFENALETSDADRAANELYMMVRPPFTRSAIYGTPAGYTAYKSMLAQMKIDDYNLQFFSNKGVPQYAVVFTNLGTATDNSSVQQLGAVEGTGDATYNMTPSEMVALENTVHEFFMEKLAQSDRSVLLLTLVGDAEVRFEKLSSDKLDADFAEYEQRCANKIRIAHRVPNAALGIDPAHGTGLGTGSRDVAQMRRYRDHIVAPTHLMLERLVNSLIRSGLLIPYFNFNLHPMNIEEEELQSKAAVEQWEAGVITLDETRIALGREALPDGRGNIFKIKNTEQYIGDDTDLARKLTQATASEMDKLAGQMSGQKIFNALDNLEERKSARTKRK